ncbi:SAM-dependent methyltransferase [Actinosynnema sp. CA-248983]
MTDAPPVNGHALLDFNSPLSDSRSYDLIASLGSLRGSTIVDYGSGWAELLLRALEHEPSATGLGVDGDEYAINRGRANAQARGLSERVRLDLGDLTTWAGPPADVAISIGSSHAWGGTRETLAALHERIRPGGLLLLGDGFWERTPPEDLAREFEGDCLGTLDVLVDAAMEAGFRLFNVTTASLDEWDSFESRWCLARERWLLDHPDHAEAADVRKTVDEHRDLWLKGYRGLLGFAYLTLARR